MKNIEVVIIREPQDSVDMINFLAGLTQKGDKVSNADDLRSLYKKNCGNKAMATRINELPHGTIKRYTPITLAVVGASRRYLLQARTHQHIDYVSASLQYSTYNDASFVRPFKILRSKDATTKIKYDTLNAQAAAGYFELIHTHGVDNDTAGYIMPHSLRNVLIMQGNIQAWQYFLQLRSCRRNTEETRYVTALIWKRLLKTKDGECFFKNFGPPCMEGYCPEKHFGCKQPFKKETSVDQFINDEWGDVLNDNNS